MGDGLLSNRVAIVTGAGAGIGRGVVECFLAAGAQVVGVEIDSERAATVTDDLASAGDNFWCVEADVTTASGVAATMAVALDVFATVDVLVNNVGHYGGPRQPFHEQTEDDWDNLYRINLEHVFACSRAVLPTMMAAGRGTIINVSTVEAFRGIPTRAVYSAFKSGITGFTRSLALEYARYGIRVNAVAPDVTETPQVPYSDWVAPEDAHLAEQWVPIGRFGTPADIANAVLFLASDLSGFVTGTTIHADGGTLAAGGWYRTDEGDWTNRPRRP